MSGTTVHKSTCGTCSPLTNCGLDLEVENGRVVAVKGSPEAPLSAGRLCVKGKATSELVHSPDRLLHPLKRRGPRGSGDWERITWEEALETIISSFQGIKKEFGAEAVFFYVGYPKEVRPFLHRLAHAFGSPNYALVLTTGARKPGYLHSQMRGIPSLRTLAPWPEVDINPSDATDRGIRQGDLVLLTTPRGSMAMRANLTNKPLPGVVQALHGWAEADINRIVDDGPLDPISGFPPYRSMLAEVSKAG